MAKDRKLTLEQQIQADLDEAAINNALPIPETPIEKENEMKIFNKDPDEGLSDAQKALKRERAKLAEIRSQLPAAKVEHEEELGKITQLREELASLQQRAVSGSYDSLCQTEANQMALVARLEHGMTTVEKQGM